MINSRNRFNRKRCSRYPLLLTYPMHTSPKPSIFYKNWFTERRFAQKFEMSAMGIELKRFSIGRFGALRLAKKVLGGMKRWWSSLAPISARATIRMRGHEPKLAYVKKSTNDGKSKSERIRCLKRYIVREIFKHLCTSKNTKIAT